MCNSITHLHKLLLCMVIYTLMLKYIYMQYIVLNLILTWVLSKILVQKRMRLGIIYPYGYMYLFIKKTPFKPSSIGFVFWHVNWLSLGIKPSSLSSLFSKAKHLSLLLLLFSLAFFEVITLISFKKKWWNWIDIKKNDWTWPLHKDNTHKLRNGLLRSSHLTKKTRHHKHAGLANK